MAIKRSCIIAAVLAGLVSASGVRAFRPFAAPERLAAADVGDKDPTIEIAKQRVTVAKQALRTLEQLQSAGAVGKLDDLFDVWWRRLIESLRDGGGDETEFVKALNDYAEHTRMNLKSTEALFKDGKTSQTQVYDAQYQALEAQSWLAEAHAK